MAIAALVVRAERIGSLANWSDIMRESSVGNWGASTASKSSFSALFRILCIHLVVTGKLLVAGVALGRMT